MPTEHEITTGLRFDAIAADYDLQDQYPVRTLVRDRVLQILKDLCPRSVLDVGCGTGSLLIEMADHIDMGIGLDVSQKGLDLAKAKAMSSAVAGKLRFEFAGFTDLPRLIADGLRCDVAVATYSMHHLEWPEKEAAIRSMADSTAGDCGSVIIGDLMLFEDPSTVTADERRRAGFDAQVDLPERPDRLCLPLTTMGWNVSVHRLHDLSGILIAQRTPP